MRLLQALAAFGVIGGVVALAAPQVGPDTDQSVTAGPSREFTRCGTSPRINCVVDGDTVWIDGVKIRVLDIDTPETHEPQCAAERQSGERATARLIDWMNAGPVKLVTDGRDEDRYGRKLRRLVRDGESLSEVLIAEGLARPYDGGRRSWC